MELFAHVNEPDPSKRCLDCGYILDHLPEPRCPECGRGFDPHNPGTYGPRDTSGELCLSAAKWGGGVALVGLLLFVLAALDWVPPEGAFHARLNVGAAGIGIGALIELGDILTIGVLAVLEAFTWRRTLGRRHFRALGVAVLLLAASIATLVCLPTFF